MARILFDAKEIIELLGENAPLFNTISIDEDNNATVELTTEARLYAAFFGADELLRMIEEQSSDSETNEVARFIVRHAEEKGLLPRLKPVAVE